MTSSIEQVSINLNNLIAINIIFNIEYNLKYVYILFISFGITFLFDNIININKLNNIDIIENIGFFLWIKNIQRILENI